MTDIFKEKPVFCFTSNFVSFFFPFKMQVFRKDELQKMLSLLRDTSLAALGKNLDPLGYDMEHR